MISQQQSGVPDYHVEEFTPRKSRYCVCLFVLNEHGRLERQLERMQDHVADLDIVIADGGSTDGCTEASRLQSAGVRALLTKTGPGKLGAQMRMAFAWALNEGYEGVIAMDGNNKDDPDALPRFVTALDDGYDHVQGSRFIVGGVSENLPRSRWWAIKTIHAPLIRLAAGFPYTDTTNGFRGYSRRLLESPAVAVFRDEFVGYELHYYLAIRAARLNLKVLEIPVARRYPATGPVPSKISPIKGNLNVIRCLAKTCLGRYTP